VPALVPSISREHAVWVHLGNRQMVQGVNGQGIAYCVNDLKRDAVV
jgi:hypothetical protein